MNKTVQFRKKEKGLLKSGAIGGLEYKIFDRNNIEMTDGVSTFRKDRSVLSNLIGRIDFECMKDEDTHKIEGAGDTDPLIICKEKGEVKFKLGSKKPAIIVEFCKLLGM